MAHNVTITETHPQRPGVTWNSRAEYRIICDKCGLVDKAGTEREAQAIANRHRDFPHRPLTNPAP